MQRYMLSFLKQKYRPLELKAFREVITNDCLLWEPGSWSPSPKDGATVVAVTESVAPKTPKSGDALVMMLEKPPTEFLTLGRDPSCELVVDDATVSTVHLKLSLLNYTWRAESLASTNGVFVNDKELLPQKPIELRTDDQLRLGQVKLTFYDPKSLYFRLKAVG